MKVKKSILRYFGLIWVGFVLLAFPLLFDLYELWNIYSIIASAILFIVALFTPKLILPIYLAQAYVGKIIGNIISKIILTLTFYLLVFPIGLILKLTGKDLLNKKIDKNVSSYWLRRDKQPGKLQNQF